MSKFVGSKQALLNRKVGQSIIESGLTLDQIQRATGIHRAKLGRMRLCRCPVTCDEAEKVFAALRFPSRAMITLAALGEDRARSPEAMAFLENFLGHLPNLLDRLDALGSSLNPGWAHGSARHLGALMTEHAQRRQAADTFESDRHRD